MFVLGTAGHVDHGKSTLVRALTGIDPDRLAEEKERGMTIDLGFAWLKLPGGQEVGIVDVPGHDRFIKNMLAGVGGIDLALLVIAANEGVMPQTREHLAILDLLGVKKGIVVITKKDLADEDVLSLARMEIEELLSSTTLGGSLTMAVSATTGDGLPQLLTLIEQTLSSIQPRKDTGRPRLPIDRVFTIPGSGTVVTGTLIDGALSRGMEVEIVPSNLRSRIRGLQTHKASVEVAEPGSRVAANLAGISVSEVTRGDVLTTRGWLLPTTLVDVKMSLLDYLGHALRHNASVSFHTGAAEAMARVRLLQGDELKPGQSGWAQLVLSRPMAVVKRDRFIIRSPDETMGGGEIIDPHPRMTRRSRSQLIQSLEARGSGAAEQVILALLEVKQPHEEASVLAQTALAPDTARVTIQGLVSEGKLVALGQGENRILFTASGWQRLVDKTTDLVLEYHRRFPVRQGMPRAELENRLKLPARAFAGYLERLSQNGVLAQEEASVRAPWHVVRLTPAQQSKTDSFLDSLRKNPYSPPGDLIPDPDLLNLLVEQRRVAKVGAGIVFAASAYDEMVRLITEHIKKRGKITLAEVRDLFGTSRKYAQALLEYLDERKITRRIGDERVLR